MSTYQHCTSREDLVNTHTFIRTCIFTYIHIHIYTSLPVRIVLVVWILQPSFCVRCRMLLTIQDSNGEKMDKISNQLTQESFTFINQKTARKLKWIRLWQRWKWKSSIRGLKRNKYSQKLNRTRTGALWIRTQWLCEHTATHCNTRQHTVDCLHFDILHIFKLFVTNTLYESALSAWAKWAPLSSFPETWVYRLSRDVCQSLWALSVLRSWLNTYENPQHMLKLTHTATQTIRTREDDAGCNTRCNTRCNTSCNTRCNTRCSTHCNTRCNTQTWVDY